MIFKGFNIEVVCNMDDGSCGLDAISVFHVTSESIKTLVKELSFSSR